MIFNFLQQIYDTINFHLFAGASQIIPRLFISDSESSVDYNFIIKNNISLIVNCTPDEPFINSTSITYIRIPVYDSLLERDLVLMEQYLKVLLQRIIDEYIINNKTVLIHCRRGKQRSCIVVAAMLYEMIRQNLINPEVIGLPMNKLTKKELADYIIAFIVTKRPQAFTFGYRVNFVKTLYRYIGI